MGNSKQVENVLIFIKINSLNLSSFQFMKMNDDFDAIAAKIGTPVALSQTNHIYKLSHAIIRGRNDNN